MGHNSLRVHFGLSDASKVDSLIIEWPSGLREVYTDVEAREFHKFKEGESLISGLREIVAPDSFKLFPNPASTEINVDLSSFQEGTEIQIADLSGRIVYHQANVDSNPGRNTLTIPIKGIDNGIYLMKVLSDKRFFTSKFMVIE